MDTYCTITVVSSSREKAAGAIDRGFAEIKKLEGLLNYFSDESEVTAINNAAGVRPVKVSPETLELINRSVEIAEATHGAFDPTIAPVISLWNFSSKGTERPAPALPDTEAVKKALTLVDYRNIVIDNNRSEVFLNKKGMEIDLGGIAKGFAADKAMEAVKAEGIRSALVAVAGDIRGTGERAAGGPWNVGIQDPRPGSESERPWEDVIATIHLRDSAISTSGDYQRFFIKDGKRYHHILDPGTGFPAETDLVSASVIAPEGHSADGLSTAVFVLGAERGMELLRKMNIDGMLVTSEKKVLHTMRHKNDFTILKDTYRIAD